MEGWRSVEELIGWGFAHAQVVMANEAHNGPKRCIRTREVGIRMIRAAHEAGVRRLAMEALPWPEDGSPGPIRSVPSGWGGYLAQPDMGRLITVALELGWSLWAYEAVMEVAARADPERPRDTAAVNEKALDGEVAALFDFDGVGTRLALDDRQRLGGGTAHRDPGIGRPV